MWVCFCENVIIPTGGSSSGDSGRVVRMSNSSNGRSISGFSFVKGNYCCYYFFISFGFVVVICCYYYNDYYCCFYFACLRKKSLYCCCQCCGFYFNFTTRIIIIFVFFCFFFKDYFVAMTLKFMYFTLQFTIAAIAIWRCIVVFLNIFKQLAFFFFSSLLLLLLQICLSCWTFVGCTQCRYRFLWI